MLEYNDKPIPEFLRISIQSPLPSNSAAATYKYDDKRILVATYKSMGDAAKDNNISKSTIYNAIRKGIKAYGFYWRR